MKSFNVERRKFLLTTVTILLIISLFTIGCAPKWQVTPLEPPPEPVTAENGIVVAAHPMAAEAGISVLKDGGNAVDATLAALFMLNVVEPHASGLGGGGFAMVRTAGGDAKVVVYRERAPEKVDPLFYADPTDTLHVRMKAGPTSVCVPGAAAGWAELYERWHTLPLERLARDAIKAAEDGFPIDQTLAGQIANNYAKLVADSFLTETFLKKIETGDTLQPYAYIPYEVGDTLRQPYLAATLRTLVDRGLRSFYRGHIAESIVNAVTSGGGTMSLDDLEFYKVEVTEPVRGEYKDYDLLSIPPPSRGGVALIEILNLFDATSATEYGLGDPQSIHLMSQCIQQAYTDARFRVSDQKFIKTDWRKMLKWKHAKIAAEGISLETKPGMRFPAGEPDSEDHGNTSHLVVVDREGNAVSLTQSSN